MELIDLDIESEDQLDFQIALVDSPAIESNWMAFNKQHKFVEMKKGIISGYAMIANLPIPRIDEKGEVFQVRFSKRSIERIVDNFFRNGLTTNSNEMHQSGNLAEGVFVFESMIVDKDRGMIPPKQFPVLEGSWFISMKVENEEIRKKILSGEYKGFSIEGTFVVAQEQDKSEELIEKIRTIILEK